MRIACFSAAFGRGLVLAGKSFRGVFKLRVLLHDLRSPLRAPFARPIRFLCCCLTGLVLSGMSAVSYAEGTVNPTYSTSAPPFIKYDGYVGVFDTPEAACQDWVAHQFDTISTTDLVYDHVGPSPSTRYPPEDFVSCFSRSPRGAIGWLAVMSIRRSCDGISWVGHAITCPRNVCPANSTGAPEANPTICTCNTGYFPDPTKTSCVQENLTITLVGGKTTEPGTSLPFIATVTDQDKQPPKKPVTIKISLKVDSTSGGHDHGTSDRPRGGIAGIATCPSDDTCWKLKSPANDGVAVFNFNAPEASGTHTITATCDECMNNPQTAEVNVKVKESDAAGWDSLSESPSDYELIGGEEGKNHTDNHYLTASAQENLLAIVRRYNKKYPEGPVLYLNDASLEWGGRFDISGTWGGFHNGHRRGKEIDIRANQLPSAISFWRFADFKSIAADNGASASVHCSFPAKYSWACWFDMGENRHFHVRLTGK